MAQLPFEVDVVSILAQRKRKSRELGKLLMVEMVVQMRYLWFEDKIASHILFLFPLWQPFSGKALESVQKEIRCCSFQWTCVSQSNVKHTTSGVGGGGSVGK